MPNLLNSLLHPKSQDNSSDLFSSRRFRFGFVCFHKAANANTAEINFWNQLVVNEYVLFTHPETTTYQVTGRDAIAVFVGDVFVCATDRSLDELTLAFLDHEDWDAFDCLSGRFALLIFTPQGGKVLHDPFGARSIFYRESGDICIGSHAFLVAEMFGDELDPEIQQYISNPEYNQRGTRHLPGDLTLLTNVLGLAPNNFYNLVTREIQRYWPRHEVDDVKIQEFLKLSDEYFLNLAKFLRGRYKPVLGLTGGVDSRTMIASLRAQKFDCRLITWSGKWITEAELPIVKKLAQYLGYEHSYLDYSNFEGSQNWVIYQELSKLNKGESKPNLSSQMQSSLAAAMAQAARPGDTFIRGWGGEILRGFYNIHNRRRRIDQHNPRHLTKLYLTNRVKEPNPYFYQFTMQAFEKFIVRANYTEDFHYLDPQDLFYWEQRMGMWGASWLNAIDPAMYSIIGMNSRTLYAASFGLPPASRNTPELLEKITARFDKKLISSGKQTIKPTATSDSLLSAPRNSTGLLKKTSAHQEKNTASSGKHNMKPTRVNLYQKYAQSINFKRTHSVEEKSWASLTDAVHIERMALMLSAVYGEYVLEIGSGSGILGVLLLLSKNTISNYFCTDLRHHVIQMSRDTIQLNCSDTHKAHYCTTSGYELGFCDSCFDTVVCSEVLEHVHEPLRLIHELYRVLKPNGSAIISVPIQGVMPPGKTKGHVQDFSIADIWSILEVAGLKIYQHFQLHPWEFYFTVKTVNPEQHNL